jgi:hypothetical protein
MACAIEDAGFEIRDQIKFEHENDAERRAFLDSLDPEQFAQFIKLFAENDSLGQLSWDYGTGFPKSHDVSKGIQKSRASEDEEKIRVICRFIRAGMDAMGLVSRQLTRDFGDCDARLIDHWAARDTDSQPSLPKIGQWEALKLRLALDASQDDLFKHLDRRRGEWSDAWNSAEVIGEYDGEPGGFGDHRFSVRDNAKRAPSDAARQWEGWGTALKPAWEPICLARKPLSEKTVAANVLRWGTGAINVDGCRVESSAADKALMDAKASRNPTGKSAENVPFVAGVCSPADALGRWPANLCHDGSDEVLAAFPYTQSRKDISIKGRSAAERDGNKGSAYGKESRSEGAEMISYGDSGSAARFFYSTKASKADRAGSRHPTVKPIKLMQWLCRLITPPGGTTLDPFAGSGTTGAAAFLEGFNAVLIEREAEYQADIERRIGALEEQPVAAPDLFACA